MHQEEGTVDIDKGVLNDANLEKLEALKNDQVMEIVERYLKLLGPSKATVITDSKEDIDYVRQMTLRNGEERKLSMEGHTIHYDGYFDQARDKGATRVLVTPDMKMSKVINTKDREEGLKEVHEIMDGVMEGKEAIIRFFCLGPLRSRFAIPALQITDSSYVAHSEDLLYRSGYEYFKELRAPVSSSTLSTPPDRSTSEETPRISTREGSISISRATVS
jgi:phosphoenolpyruvate carboxykinase (GTP)